MARSAFDAGQRRWLPLRRQAPMRSDAAGGNEPEVRMDVSVDLVWGGNAELMNGAPLAVPRSRQLFGDAATDGA